MLFRSREDRRSVVEVMIGCGRMVGNWNDQVTSCIFSWKSVFDVRIPHDWDEIVLRRKRTRGMGIFDERDCIFECPSVMFILNAVIEHKLKGGAAGAYNRVGEIHLLGRL